MTEKWIREVAERFGLDILKRVTTGNEKSGFATFELYGPAERTAAAWNVLKVKSRGRDFDARTYPTNPELSEEERRTPYIELQSIYFDKEIGNDV